MKYCILTKCSHSADHIYDMLVDPVSGEGCLKGSKICLDESTVPNAMYFDLSLEEAEQLRKNSNVLRVALSLGTPTLCPPYTKTEQKHIPKLASFTTSFFGNSYLSACPHSLYYHQNIDLNYIQNNTAVNGSTFSSLSSIDCSSVDILVLDSGVDATHRDFFDSNNVTRVINFNWTQLKQGSGGDMSQGAQIVPSQDANYYTDQNGHGTACASLVAGNRCGFAKNAKIYALKCSGLNGNTGGYTLSQCLDLALSFHKSKKQGLYGLDRNRPTVFTNSWGFSWYAYYSNYENNTANISKSLGFGPGVVNSTVAEDTATDQRIRDCLDAGVHVLVAAGNNNQYLDNTTGNELYVHYFSGTGNNERFLIATNTNLNSFVASTFYSGLGTYSGLYYIPHTYGSPNVGFGFSKNAYPLITVGDIIPIGQSDSITNTHWTGGYAYTGFVGLTSLTTNYSDLSSYIDEDTATRYTSLSGPFFIKSGYSNWGPDVDVYACGNGTWAAFSAQSTDTSSPQFVAGLNNNFKFFNGTSAATPVAAGVLATYVAVFTGASNIEARNWLLNNSVSGNIGESKERYTPTNCYFYNNGSTTFNAAFNWPTGTDTTQLQSTPGYRTAKSNSFLSIFNTANVWDYLQQFKFFNSYNRVVQAYPLRRAVLSAITPTININSTTLNLSSGPVSVKISHVAQ